MKDKSDRPGPAMIGGVILLVLAVIAFGYYMMKSATKGDLDGVQLTPHPFSPPPGYKPPGAKGANAPAGSTAGTHAGAPAGPPP